MLRYAMRRLLFAIPTLLIIITAAFFLMRFAPGSPFDADRPLSPEVRANVEAAYGFDKPLYQQYGDYLVGLVQGDFGPSLKYKDKTVSEIIVEGAPTSITIGVLALSFALIVGGILGVFAALNQNRAGDFGAMSIALFGISIPPFVVGPVLSLVLGVYLGVLPVAGLIPGRGVLDPSQIPHLILPVITLALPQIAIISRLMRASMIEVMRSNYMRTARAKGVPNTQVLVRHGLRAAIVPLVSYLGPATAGLLTGSLVVEQVFQLPGIGQQFVIGALNRDYTVVLGVVVVYATLIILCNLIADLLYGVLDPKVRYQ